MLYLIYISIILILILVLKLRNTFLNFDQIIIKIIEGEENIDFYLKEKSRLLYDICKSINDINKNKVFSSISKLKKNDFDSFKLDRELNSLDLALKEYLILNKSFVADDKTQENLKLLNLNEIELNGSKIYYNDNSKIYNKMIDKFSNKILVKRRNLDYKYLFSFEKEELFKIMSDKKKKNALKV